ncbi:MAG: phenylalanine--tRNA ligase subunit beta [Gammaproteobacteria bacterium]|nr:phenylalanine--tRNA ligase subunit beta [Gammaproteobacteria bacterium]
MIISYQWLCEWVSPPSDIAHLCDSLTMAGLEVGSANALSLLSNRVVVGEVLTVETVANHSGLHLCCVDTGHTRSRTIVCGADNVYVGMKAAVALPGAKLSNGLKVKQRSIAGFSSNGMLCSSQELGLNEDSSGILWLDDDAVLGRTLNDHLGLDDVLLDIELTPNRGDCLSVAGVAREVAAVTGAALTPPIVSTTRARHRQRIPIVLEEPKDCPRWVGRALTGLDPNARTPDFLRERLRRCGIRGIGLVVDVTNYVMLEYGQPMHAFKMDSIDRGIRVRRSKSGEALTLLDQQQVTLAPGTLVIADETQAIAIAGVMGGLSTAVSDSTQQVLLEAAYFRPGAVAQRARQMGLQTDAVYRFERGVDPHQQKRAISRATQLLTRFAGAQAGPVCEAVVSKYVPSRRRIKLRRKRLDRILGTRLAGRLVKGGLERLQMDVQVSGSDWLVRPPSYRLDVSYEHDLIEEVARINNFETLPTRLPHTRALRGIAPEQNLPVTVLQDLLVARGYQEVITYSFVDGAAQQLISPKLTPVTLRNPIAANMNVMRTSLWPGLLETMVRNLRRQEDRIRIFESGRVFSVQNGMSVERTCIGGAILGLAFAGQWDGARAAVDFFDLKGDVEALLSYGEIAHSSRWRSTENVAALHPGESAEILLQNKPIGLAGKLHPDLADYYGLEQPIYLFELDLEEVLARKIPHYKSVSRFPALSRDLSVVVSSEITASQVIREIRAAGGDYLCNIEVFDVYRGKGIESTEKSLSFALTLQSTSRNLTDGEIDRQIDKIVEAIGKNLGGTLRS